MNRDEVLGILRGHADELRKRGVIRLQIFGSVARDEATEKSDVDLLADFDPELGLIAIGGIQVDLEEMLGQTVDLSSPDWLKPRISQSALRDVVHVF